MQKTIVIFITTSSQDEAKKIGQILREENLIACCNIVPSIESIFTWQGRTLHEKETLMICKTREDLFGAVEKRVRQLHSYDVPEIIALPIIQGSKDYLDWVAQETKTITETEGTETTK
ncbi:MAG: cytochrome C biogenesis protein CcdA [Candidatus Brocadia sp.]|nr:Divalent-cation tolerance protein CutA [Candidatus Brocadia fulgida]MCC6325426.1 divalent-cation tolerance protein CutA [Candidatus Brocadia sp.]MCE7910931.1 divalent-cation tolerance protein CutA [Candidatus Brocadia sp. AMX3]MDG5997243.1 divalent-cation tolerance protein CutA [Candidatus Brocadia sp.]RIK00843.1 MAG: cytochrome C biogenesis protein CcdA [Candidatus Brocadia sp.]